MVTGDAGVGVCSGPKVFKKRKERSMKRIISCLLVVALVLAPCVQASAQGTEFQISENNQEINETQAPGDEQATDQEENALDSEESSAAAFGTEDSQQQDITEEPEEPEVFADEANAQNQQNETVSGDQPELPPSQEERGQLDVTIVSSLATRKSIDFKASILGADAPVQEPEKTITLKESVTVEDGQEQVTAVRANAVFTDLSPQEYTVTVTAPGFAAYTQKILIDDSMAYKIQLMTGPVEGFDENSHPGILRIGDVDGNGQIDDADKDKLVDVLDGADGKDLQTDLNGDGQTDLVDLEYFAKSYQEPDVTSTVQTRVPEEVVTVSPNSVKVVQGAIEDVLTSQGGHVALSPANEGTISPENPVEVEFQLDDRKQLPVGGVVIGTDSENPVTKAEITFTYEDENGQEQQASAYYDEAQVAEGVHYLLKSAAAQALGVTVTRDSNGAICLNLGTQAPIKKVTIKITGVKKNNNLAEISKVEFIGDMASRIPEPQTDIPQGVTIENASQAFTVNWKPCVNVTGYEVWVALEEAPDKPAIKQVTGNTLKITSIGESKDDKIKNGKRYVVKVQAVNGTWRSGYSEEKIAEPKSDKVPVQPDYVGLTGKYRSIVVSWKKVEDADSYNVYYKKVEGETQYKKISGITGTSYTISDLEDVTKYEVYVTAENTVGEGAPSLTHWASTVDLDPAKMPKYKRINEAGEGQVSPHIKSATVIGGGEMVDSPLDTERGTILGTVDNDHGSYYRIHSWDLGGFNDNNNGLYYEFDQPYKIRNIGLQTSEAHYTDFSYRRIRYWDENNVPSNATFTYETKTDDKGKRYFWIRLSKPITAKKIKIGLGRYLATEAYSLITVSEVNFYHYDQLEDDIEALYEDGLHTVLKKEVTLETINGLRTRLNTKDPASGEYHPDKALLEKDLQMAEDILNAKDLTAPVSIHKSITTSDKGRGFTGLNAWQPLGVTAAAGEKLNVYVGHETMNAGQNTGLQLCVSQYHSESSGVITYTKNLVIGRNQIDIPRHEAPEAGCEAGGALYVQYTGARDDNDKYAVRVDGGVQVPVLDLYRVTDKEQRLAKAETYAAELDTYVGKMEQTHEERHQVSENALVNVEYNAQNCILGASDILLDNMLLSLPAQQILAGSGTGTAAQRAAKIVDSMDAMEAMMNLFYQHKGLNNSAKDEVDRLPNRHLNIRYQRMFAGAFMYAGGNHIGIEYGSAPGMIGGVPVQADEKGKYISGQYFGWGIAHEIGHDINQGAYAVAEITNNYFAVLAQAKDTNDSVRFQYRNVYDKVTSGTKGRATNVFTQLGMYWQLHLAYDNGYNFKTYADYNEQLDNLFFARVDTYARTASKAPKPGGVALNLGGGTDQSLMRLSCAAAEKNILEFFERWGMTPDAGTIAYAEQFEKETRAIFYASDDARVYRLEHAGSSLSTNSAVEAVGDGTTAKINASAANKVDITLQSKTIPVQDILGYEITRCITSNGDVSEQAVGFALPDANGASSFTDTVTTINNRVVSYKITLIDKYLNRSAVKELTPVKIEHEGEIDKTAWTVSVNNVTSDEDSTVKDEADDDLPCGPEKEHPIVKTIDNDLNTAFTGTTAENAEVILEFNRMETVVAFKYTNKSGTPIGAYSISMQGEDGVWKEAAAGTFDANEDSQTVYFANDIGNIAAYNATALKLSIKDPVGTNISISELDVLGVTGDNVDFWDDSDGQPAIGKLATAYKYEGGEIPAGSTVFMGKYKGNPAYNMVLLYDQDGNIVTGADEAGDQNASQMIFANVPETGLIQDVSNGTWVYWIEPQFKLPDLKKVRAELYRVDNAQTNEGQRMVSDSLFRDMPAELPDVTISGSGTDGSASDNSASSNSSNSQ